MGSIPPTGSNPPDWRSQFGPPDNFAQYKQQLSGYIGEANQLAQDYELGKIDAATLKSKLQDLIKQNNELSKNMLDESYKNGDTDESKLALEIPICVESLNQAVNALNSGKGDQVFGLISGYAITAQSALQYGM